MTKEMRAALRKMFMEYHDCNSAVGVREKYGKDVEDLDMSNFEDMYYAGMCYRMAYGTLKKVAGCNHETIVRLIGADPMPLTDESTWAS